MITIYFETGETLDLSLDSLVNSIFSGLELHRAIFENFDVSGADFTGANLRNASFNYSVLNRAVMHGAALMSATLVCVQIKGADLSEAIAIGADFTGEDLSSSGLKNADVFGASFVRANLCDVNFEVKRIEGACFSGAIYDEWTVWPEGFDPVVFGAIKV